uniref:HYDIN/VesB/CFA65-like Ig-like domain-containing protein n=1 Tax=Timema douglasi TaxID=61478 RepID=A0A7R8ZBV6_TIMDO|nr:unnamed protein product [Timema douglasi]
MFQRKWALDPTQANTINFGSIPPKTPQTIMFVLTNIGKTSFYYQLKYDEEISRKLGIKLDFSERGGHVTSQSRTSTTLTMTLLKKSFVKNFELILEDSCLDRVLGHTLGALDISGRLECLYENKPHLKINVRSDPIPPEGSIFIPIFFYPLERLKYSETLHFIINGFQEKKIIITGEGVDIKVFLVQPRHKLLSFGALQVGHIASKCVPIVNKSKAPVPMLLTVVDPPSVLPTSSANKLTDVFHITPKTPVVIQPNETISVTVKFKPNRRIKPFSEKLYMQIHENVEPLCLMMGSCIGSEFQLDRKYLPFGMVVQGCQSSLKLLLSNTGELGARFCWSRDNCDNLFTITPASGYLSPGVTITFIVDFHPINLQQNIRCDSILVKGGSDGGGLGRNYPIARLTRSGETWQLFPEMSGEYFLGQDTIQVVPHSVKLYEVTYTPLVMTEHDNKHMGSVFFRLPEGQVLLYSLVGTAEPPVAVARIAKEVPSKTPHIEILPVFNWLPVAQRFKVTTNLIKSEKFDPVFTLTGNDYIDVPGNSDRDHRLTFFSYKECSLIFKVSFTNEDSGEYQFYDLALRVFKCGSLDTFKMETFVRKPITYELKLKNPLNSVVNFNISCYASDVQFPTPNSVPAKTMKYVTLEYLPLHPGENHVRLDIQCSELGVFPYELVLNAIPAPKEKPLIFNTSLGIAVSLEAQFNNLAHTKADFGCKVDHNDFHVDKSVLVAPAHTGNVEVTYEPSSLGSVHALLTITSTTGGEFIFPLIGKCTPPKPQGPIVLKPGTGITIPFKNVFRETKTFMLYLDCPSFVLKNNIETIKSKKLGVRNLLHTLPLSSNAASGEGDARAAPITPPPHSNRRSRGIKAAGFQLRSSVPVAIPGQHDQYSLVVALPTVKYQ